MTAPTQIRTRRSRQRDNSPVANEDRAAKALATADAIGQRVNSLIRHLASLDEHQLHTVAEPVLESLAATVASIHHLHTLFAGWASEHPDDTTPSRDTAQTGNPAGSLGDEPAADGSASILDGSSPAGQRQTANHTTPQPQPANASEPAGPASAPAPATPGDQQPATVPTGEIGQQPAAGANTSGPPAHHQPPQHAPLDTVADLARWMTDVSPGTPIRLHHDDTAYLLHMHHTDGRLVLTIAQPDS